MTGPFRLPPFRGPEPAAYFLVGPTAAGKSAAAQWLAERLDADVLSADSMQVYTGMDIGTAKPTRAERARVRYHGLDLVDPDCAFSVGDYLRIAHDVLRRNRDQGRPTLVVGGTGLYVKALTDGLDAGPGSDTAAEAHWDSVLRERGVSALCDALRQRSPGLLESLRDPCNPRRLIRALVRCGQEASHPATQWTAAGAAAFVVGVDRPAAEHLRRIERRVDAMYRSGLVEEAAGLRGRYAELSRTARHAIGYAEAMECLAGNCGVAEAIARTVVRTRQLAKRQRTWFRHQARVDWVCATGDMTTEQVAELVLARWREHGPTGIAA